MPFFRTITTFALSMLPMFCGYADQNQANNKYSASFISKDEMAQYFKRVPANVASDQQVRAVDAPGAHIDVGVVYRGKESANGPVAQHDFVSEVYYVIDGSATLVTGTDIIGLKRRPADDIAVKFLNGPGSNGVSIRNGKTYELKPGDVVVIPAGVGHWFTKIDDHIRYVMIRVDPKKLTPLKNEAASLEDIKQGVNTGSSGH